MFSSEITYASNIETFSTLFALLAVAGLVFLFVVLVLWIVSLVRGGVPEVLVPLREGMGQAALPLALAVAAVCMFGSLFYSESAKFPPCVLCWYQRICMYPQVVLLGVALIRRDVKVKFYAIPLAVIGISISTYHYLLERFPDSIASSCTDEVPCSYVWIWRFHFLSIPGMAWVGFALIIVLLLLARPSERTAVGPDSEQPDSEQPDSEKTEEVSA